MKKSYSFFYILILSLLLSNCNDPTFLGTDLLKEDEIDLDFVDSFRIDARTILDTGVITYNPQLLQVLSDVSIGNFSDPVFGNCDASLYTQFVRSVAAPNFKDSKLDSIVLYLALDSITRPYGATSGEQSFEVFEMDERISFSTEYRSGSYDFKKKATRIGLVENIKLDHKKTIPVIEPTDTVDFPPHLAIKLSNTYGNAIMNLDSTVYNSDSIFLATVRGLWIHQTNQSNKIFHFKINSSFSRISVYHTKGTSKEVYSYYFLDGFTGLAAPRVPHWKHLHSPNILSALNDVNKGNEILYLQSYGGLQAKLEFPNLKLDSNSIINKAEMEFTVLDVPEDNSSFYTPAPQLALFRKDANGNDFFIADQANQSDYSFLGGKLVSKETNGVARKSYTFNVSNHIQAILEKKEKAEVYIGIAPETLTTTIPTPPHLTRVVIAGPKNPLFPVKLKISYTKF